MKINIENGIDCLFKTPEIPACSRQANSKRIHIHDLGFGTWDLELFVC